MPIPSSNPVGPANFRPRAIALPSLPLSLKHTHCAPSAELGTTSVGDLGKGPNSMEFAAKELNFAGVKASRLTTAGMLTCALRRAAEGAPADGDEELAAVNMVVQVETASGKPAGKTTDPSELVRTVFDPLA